MNTEYLDLLVKFIIEVRIELDSVLLAVSHDIFGPNKLGDLDQLILVISALEEGLP